MFCGISYTSYNTHHVLQCNPSQLHSWCTVYLHLWVMAHIGIVDGIKLMENIRMLNEWPHHRCKCVRVANIIGDNFPTPWRQTNKMPSTMPTIEINRTQMDQHLRYAPCSFAAYKSIFAVISNLLSPVSVPGDPRILSRTINDNFSIIYYNNMTLAHYFYFVCSTEINVDKDRLYCVLCWAAAANQ